MSDWVVEQRRGSAAELHAWEPAETTGRHVVVMEASSPALVLGSTQAEGDVDPDVARSLGVEVVRRRSGGGAVLVEPGGLVWVDVVVPRGDPLWSDDVGRAFEWLGDAWARALAALGVHGSGGTAPVVHRGRLVRSPLSPVVCFAGLGPGEVTIDGRKVVGASQRRTRGWARFQSSLLLRWDPDRHAALLRPGVERALAAGGGPGDPVAAVRALPLRAVDLRASAVLDALESELPAG